jgi:hypothetical protein
MAGLATIKDLGAVLRITLSLGGASSRNHAHHSQHDEKPEFTHALAPDP